jgi:membrane-associated phospholipid phosphatase
MDNYQAHGALIGGGISAFPSMHVALAVWFALILRDRNLATLGVAYAFGVFFCSVILGWHYVADGAAGIGIALLADWLIGMWNAARQGPAANRNRGGNRSINGIVIAKIDGAEEGQYQEQDSRCQ